MNVYDFLVTIGSSSLIVTIFQAFIGLKLQARMDRELMNSELRHGVLTQRQADVLSSIYSCLYDVSQALKRFSSDVQSDSRDDLLAKGEQKLQWLNRKFQDVFGRQQIFLPLALAKRLKESSFELNGLITEHGRSSYVPESACAEEIGVMVNRIQHLHVKLNENLEALANEMRTLLGAGK